jgi:hypothetical protein
VHRLRLLRVVPAASEPRRDVASSDRCYSIAAITHTHTHTHSVSWHDVAGVRLACCDSLRLLLVVLRLLSGGAGGTARTHARRIARLVVELGVDLPERLSDATRPFGFSADSSVAFYS